MESFDNSSLCKTTWACWAYAEKQIQLNQFNKYLIIFNLQLKINF